MSFKSILSYYLGGKRLGFSLLILLFLVSKSYGQTAGFNNTFLVLSLNGGFNTYYDLNAVTGNTDFNGASLGSFPTTGGNNILVLKGAEHNLWECGSCVITSTQLCYRVYLTGSTAPSFTCTSITNTSGFNNGCGGQDEKWDKTDLNINLTQGLAAGSYTLEVYSEAATSCGTKFASNLGANYKATFTVFNPIGPWASAVYLYNNRVNTVGSDFYNSMKPGGENNISSTRDYTGYLGEYRYDSDDLQLTGGEIKTFKNLGYDICKAELCYTVYLSGQRPSTPTFTCLGLNFYQDCCIDQNNQPGCGGVASANFPNSPGTCQSGDEKWQSPGTSPASGFPVDLTNRPTGLYVMEVYYQVYGRSLSGSCSSPTIVYDNNNDPANNYKVSFLILAPLPSNNIDLMLSRTNKSVQLNWAVQEAASNKNYQIEHSVDGVSFTTIGQIQNTTGANIASYRFLHTYPSSGLNFYRIKAETDRGRFEYSSIRQLNLRSFEDQLSVTVMQAGDIIRFSMPTEKVYKLALFNTSGQLMQEVPGIRNQIMMDLSPYPKGYYIARFTSDNDVINTPFVKK